ncbi:MAG: DUF350 domain-containing protein [Hyphomicrobiales bacterium]
MDFFKDYSILSHIANGVIYLIEGLVLITIAKLVYGIVRPKINVKSELVDKDNFSFSLAHVGYFIGLIIALGGIMSGTSYGLVQDILDLCIYGILVIILLNLGIWLNDKLVFGKLSLRREIIEDRNEGAGVIEAANAIASGLIIYGAILGESESYLNGILYTVIFWAIGQVLLVITSKIYNLITPYDVFGEIERDNVAVGVGFAGTTIAIGNLICYAISADGATIGELVFNILFYTIFGLILLPLARTFCDVVLLPGRKLTDEIVNQEKPNVGAAVIEAFAYIASSVLIIWSI